MEIKGFSVRDLKKVLILLDALESNVPEAVTDEIISLIHAKETQKELRKLSRMTEEDLARYQNKRRTRLRIQTSDGYLIERKSNDDTMKDAIVRIGLDRVQHIEYMVKRKPLFYVDVTEKRKRISGYTFLRPGLFLYKRTTAVQKMDILQYLDETFQLDWDIELR